jgi:predicted PurR-regulated permease PerM
MIDFMEKQPPVIKLAILFPLVFLNVWLLSLLCVYLQPIVSILVTAGLAAFLLNYPIRLLEQLGLKRYVAIGAVFLVALILLVVLGFFLVPLLLEQLKELITNLPSWLESGSKQLEQFVNSPFAQGLPVDVSNLVAEPVQKITNEIQSLARQSISFVLSTLGSIINILITLVLAIFLILGGENFWNGIFDWLPAKRGRLLQESIAQSLQNYFAGQGILAILLSVVLSIIFTIMQVPYGLLFGIGAGLISFVPYGGVFGNIIVTVLVMLQNFGLGLEVLAVTLVIGQINENIVAPRLLGEIIGLNPAWLLLSLLVGAKIAGLLGLILAVPIASAIKNTAIAIRDTTELLPEIEPAKVVMNS